MPHVRFYSATKSQRATVQLHAATLSRKPNQTNATDDDILGSSLVLVGCLAERQRAINRRAQKRLDMEQCI